MRITDILQPECIKVPLEAQQKQSAIFELVDLLTEKTSISDAEELKKAVWDRETTRTTGIGHGIAIPHGKCGGVDRLRMAIGVTTEPIDFGAIDGKPVHVIFLLASPVDQTGPHIQILAKISRMLTDEKFRVALKEVNNSESLYELIQKNEAGALV